jgi:hypothetical protein
MVHALVSALLHSRTQAHIFHWRTHSFAAHKALQEYYEGIVPLTDNFVEGYQGRYGLISGYRSIPLNQNPMNARGYFIRLLRVIGATKVRDTYLQNILDEIRQLVNQTLYLLTLDAPRRASTKVRRTRRKPTSRKTLVRR